MGGFTHRSADFVGVTPALLRDASLVSGLLVAAAGAAGLNAAAGPTVRARVTGGVSAVLVLDAEGGHLIVHTQPELETLMLDVLTGDERDADKAIDVFVRRLAARDVRRGRAPRG